VVFVLILPSSGRRGDGLVTDDADTHTGLLILQPDGWIEQTRFKKIKLR